MLSNLKKINSVFFNKPINFRKFSACQLWTTANTPAQKIPKFSKRLILLLKSLLRMIYNSILTTPIIKSPKTGKSDIFFIRNHSRPNIENHVKYFENIEHTSVCVFKNRKTKITATLIIFIFTLLIQF